MLNSKAEWGGARIPRLTVEVGARVKMMEYQGGAQGARRVPASTPASWQPPRQGGPHPIQPSPRHSPTNKMGGTTTTPKETGPDRRRKRCPTRPPTKK